MGEWPEIVGSFTLTVSSVVQQYTQLPADASETFFHYTTESGLEGILRSGGLRATCRTGMNDPAEFDYARNLIFDELRKLGERHDLPVVAQSLTANTRRKLENFLENPIELSRAYCACLTVSPDDGGQWQTYAAAGTGYALGFNLLQFLIEQIAAPGKGEPYVFCAPVIYKKRDQSGFVRRLAEASLHDLQTFVAERSQEHEHLSAIRERVTQEMIVQLLTSIDFMKAPCYSREREMRLMWDPNDGTLSAPDVRHFDRNSEAIPYIFMDLRNPRTGRLPLAEIKVGPSGRFSEKRAFLESLLDELGYPNDAAGRPPITRSLLDQCV